MSKWTRYGIKSLLVVAVLIAFPLTWLANEKRKQEICQQSLSDLETIKQAQQSFDFDSQYAETSTWIQVLDQYRNRKVNYLRFFFGRRSPEKCIDESEIWKTLYGVQYVGVSGDDELDTLEQFEELPSLQKLIYHIRNLDPEHVASKIAEAQVPSRLKVCVLVDRNNLVAVKRNVAKLRVLFPRVEFQIID